MRAYRLFRLLFIAGLALSLGLYFLPRYRASGNILDAWTATGGSARNLSSFDLCLLLIRSGNPTLGGFYIASSGVELLLLLLASRRPARWVFLVGATEQLYFLAAYLLRAKSGDLSEPFLLSLLPYVGWGLSLAGFFAKPPPRSTTSPLTAPVSSSSASR